MPSISSAILASITGSQVAPAPEGIAVLLTIGGTVTVTAHVARNALERRWGARRTGEPEDWVAAYERRRSAIHAAILRRYAAQGHGPVIISA